MLPIPSVLLDLLYPELSVMQYMYQLSALLLLLVLISGSFGVKSDPVIKENIQCPTKPAGVEMGAISVGVAEGGLILVDVRTPGELKQHGKIPGSFNIPLSDVAEAFALPAAEFRSRYGFSKPSPEQLVFTCRSGVRVLEAWELLSHLGYCKARVYYGSFNEWSANGQPIEQVN